MSSSVIFLTTNVNAQINNFAHFGKSGNDELFDMKPTSDGGVIAVGYSNSLIYDDYTNKGVNDAVIIKYDSSGNKERIEWWGGFQGDCFSSIALTTDGGFIVAGYSNSNYLDFTLKGGSDAILIKFDKNWNQEWIKNFGGIKTDSFYSVVQTKDGGFIAAGKSNSTDGGFPNKSGDKGIVVKYDSSGNEQWVSSFGTRSISSFSKVVPTGDNGFIAVGYSNLVDSNPTGYGLDDAVVVKYDNNGNQQWVSVFGGSNNDRFNDLALTEDGGFIAVGESASDIAEFNNKGTYDGIAVKYDGNGNQQWSKNFGGNSWDYFLSIALTEDGFLASGNSASSDAEFDSKGFDDAIVIKCDNNGNQQWIKSFGGSDNDSFESVYISENNDIFLLTKSSSTDAGFTNDGGTDSLIMSLDIPRPSSPTITFDSTVNKIVIHPTISDDKLKVVQYKLNNSEWRNYIGEFQPVYNDDGVCVIQSKCSDIFGSVSEISTKILTEGVIESDLNVMFQQPNTLSVSLSSNSVDFGEITGIEEQTESVILTISSSASYNIQIKATSDIVGLSNNSHIIDISKLNASIDSSKYQSLSKNYTTMLSDIPKGIDVEHSLNFKLNSTFGSKSDSYFVPIKINIAQL